MTSCTLWIALMLALGAGGPVLARAPKQKAPAQAEAPKPAFTAVSFTTDDGIKLDGRRYGKGGSWIILSHQSNRDQAAWEDFAAALAKDGYTVLSYDFRGYGASQGKQGPAGNVSDLNAAIAYARTQGAQRFGLVGASMGAMATVPVAVAASPQAVVLLSIAPSYGSLVVRDDDLKALAAPRLFVSAKYDGSHADTERMAATAGVADTLIVSKGGGHGVDIFGSADGAAIQQKVVAFLETNVPPAK
ncbi:alpha/beta hydrolase [Jeongeupia naejangsanensis]|uniref:Alpha/beta fold hydrolase n=1 Tax=Jeongeupia naejangsanensis TaxID=613195 RepID=A0ABS2BJN2_9NEIS|nr:alpha/beta fold hydrolase [Jeongeupia naejangsanensis]MBM3115814.1 alpha/beta fold hydrolase [Jeongeupia naejangsanensis]